jgi:hypothetical protein
LTSTESTPDPVRLDDLADPVIPVAAQPAMAILRTYGESLALQPDAMMEAAEQRSGLSSWGDRGFEERFAVLCASLRDEGGLSPVGVATSFEMFVQMLVNRLRVEDLVAAHPEIEAIPVERPIVICGLPRTGTTYLHNSMAADPALRHLPYWESLEPVPVPGEAAGPDGVDPRQARCAAGLEMMNAALPHFVRMHEMTPEHAHEEIHLLAIDFSTMLFETSAVVPSWRDYYRSNDQTPHYRYLRRMLQVLTFLRGGSRWVLKSPQHLEQLGPLHSVFPDATFVLTHRDPDQVAASMATMVAYSARLQVDRPDPAAYGRYWGERVTDLLGACLRDRDLLPPASTIDIAFDRLVSDGDATLAEVYQLAGQPLDDLTRRGMARFQAAHPRGLHGTVMYQPEVLGLPTTVRRDVLDAYSDRFLVPR